MGYVEQNLLADERVVYRTKLHWIVYSAAITLALVGLVIGGELRMGILVLAALLGAVAYLNVRTSEFALTNKRIILKTGWIRRKTAETLLNKIEGVRVDQGIIGRALGYGTLVVIGTGGSKESFPRVVNPLEFRTRVQEATSAEAEKPASIPAASSSAREGEADASRVACPECAELIRPDAKKCRFCGATVIAKPAAPTAQARRI